MQAYFRRRGFTLVEILVALAIIGVLVALLLPAVQAAREAARQMHCSNNLKQLSLASLAFHENRGRFPPGGRFWKDNSQQPGGTCHYDKGSWLVYTLPYMEQQNLYDQLPDLDYFVPLDEPGLWTEVDPRNNSIRLAEELGVLPVRLPYLRCPSDGFGRDKAYANYVASMGPQCLDLLWCPEFAPYEQYCDPSHNGLGDWGYLASSPVGSLHEARQIRGLFARTGAYITITMCRDGTSNTILCGEALPAENDFMQLPSGGGIGGVVYPGPDWASGSGGNTGSSTIIPINYRSPADNGCGANSYWNRNVSWGFKSKHPAGAIFAFGDGSVRMLSETIDHKTYQLLGCRDDGQPIQAYD